MERISFIGDIVCDRPLLKAARREGAYDFGGMLEPARGLFARSDLVVGNFETVCAGEEKGYNARSFVYNSPDSLAFAVAEAGIRVVTTANNHCMDYGIEGVQRTNRILDEAGIRHTGTGSGEPGYLLFRCGNSRIALLSYTAVLNRKYNDRSYSSGEKAAVHLLFEPNPVRTVKGAVRAAIPYFIKKRLIEWRYRNLRQKGVATIREKSDDTALGERDWTYIDAFIAEAEKARKEADIVIAAVHSGGQFNREPGSRSRLLYEEIGKHVDLIVGNHPHVIQKIECRDGMTPTAYSLGTVNLSLSADYVSFKNLPQYSCMLHVSVDNGKAMGLSASLLRAEEDESGYLRVYPVELYAKAHPEKEAEIRSDVETLLGVLTGKESGTAEIKAEYPVWQRKDK